MLVNQSKLGDSTGISLIPAYFDSVTIFTLNKVDLGLLLCRPYTVKTNAISADVATQLCSEDVMIQSPQQRRRRKPIVS